MCQKFSIYELLKKTGLYGKFAEGIKKRNKIVFLERVWGTIPSRF